MWCVKEWTFHLESFEQNVHAFHYLIEIILHTEDRIIFISTYTIIDNNIDNKWILFVESPTLLLMQGVLENNIMWYSFVSDLLQIGGFSLGIPVSSTNKTDLHDITEILLKVALNTITLH